jgi:hypothetical protein
MQELEISSYNCLLQRIEVSETSMTDVTIMEFSCSVG